MNRILGAWLLSIMLTVLTQAHGQTELRDTMAAKAEWVVVLSDPRPARLKGWRSTGYSKTRANYRNSLALKRFGTTIASEYDLELRDQWLIQTLSRLKEDEQVKWVQPSNEFKLLKVVPDEASSSVGNYNQEASIPTGIDGAGVIIAVIDSAVDTQHQDLVRSIAKSDDFVIAGTKAVGGETHGTAIASVMIAQRDTKLGVAGVAPAATVEAYRGCWESETNEATNCNTLSLARALDAVARSNADILNLSLSGPKDDLLDRLIQRLIVQGKMVVAAFDPERPNSPRFPSERDGVLIVRAIDLHKIHEGVFTAPGSRVVASPGNGYDFMQGHSVATAYVSGVLALRKQATEKNSYNSKLDWRNVSTLMAAEELIQELRQNALQPATKNLRPTVLSGTDHLVHLKFDRGRGLNLVPQYNW